MQPYALQSDENCSWDKMSQELKQIRSVYVFQKIMQTPKAFSVLLLFTI